MDNAEKDAAGDGSIHLTCKSCGCRIRASAASAGKKARCPNCKNIVVIPAAAAPEPAPSDEKPIMLRRSLAAEQQSRPLYSAAEELPSQQPIQTAPALLDKPQDNNKRQLPLLLDLLAYPASVAGTIHYLIFWLGPLVVGVVRAVVPCRRYFFYRQVAFYHFLYGLIFVYMLYYLGRCVVDSALGGRRAPDVTLETPPSLGDLIERLGMLFGCIVLCFAPAAAYVLYFRFTAYIWATDVVFFALVGLGAFLFPMTILAVTMFNSTCALNPALIIISIFRTLIPYCGLLLLFCGAGLLMYMLSPRQPGWGLVFWAADVYLLFIGFHLLGRFFRRYKDKLNWEV